MIKTKGCYVFDIDGTLADLRHRRHHIQKDPKDWGAFFAACMDDVPIGHICALAIDLSSAAPILLVTGRSDAVRTETDLWIRTKARLLHSGLYMRKEGDHRSDEIVKAELLEQVMGDGYQPMMVFDDRARVVAMWRAAGIPCAQVAEGDF